MTTQQTLYTRFISAFVARKILSAFLLLTGFSSVAQTTYTFGLTSSIQTLALSPGTYEIDSWGANGGTGTYYSGNNGAPINGGWGGYSTGTINITSATTLYIVVGGRGTNINSAN